MLNAHSVLLEPQLPASLRNRVEREYTNRCRDDWGGKFILHGNLPGPNAVRLDGNDYLSVTGHPRIVQAQIDALQQVSQEVIQSGIFQLDDHPARAFEKSMAAWIGKQDTVLCQSGYSANVGLLQAIADANTPVYLDSQAHMSLWEGARAARAPARPFRHNDPAHLERMIKARGPGVIVVDAIYSTNGAMCPLTEMVEVAERQGCILVVDESHSVGTHGPQGAGLCAELGLTHRVHFITLSLAKAFAGRAGLITMPSAWRTYVQGSSFPHVFSSSLLSHEVAGLAATLDVIRGADEARQRLHATAARLRASLAAVGYPIQQGTEQIISLEAGTESATMRLRDELESHDVVGAIFCAPATTKNRALVRLTLNASLTEAEITHVERVTRELAPVLKPWEWPIARRMASVSGEIVLQ
jgi:CAI-1 autoinducer synthase